MVDVCAALRRKVGSFNVGQFWTLAGPADGGST